MNHFCLLQGPFSIALAFLILPMWKSLALTSEIGLPPLLECCDVTWMLWLKMLTTQPSWDCHKKQDGLVRLLSGMECNVLFFKTWVQFPAPILSGTTTWNLNSRGSDSLWSRLCRTHMKITKLNKGVKKPSGISLYTVKSNQQSSSSKEFPKEGVGNLCLITNDFHPYNALSTTSGWWY